MTGDIAFLTSSNIPVHSPVLLPKDGHSSHALPSLQAVLGQSIHTKDSPGVYPTGEDTDTTLLDILTKNDLHESVYYPIKLILHAFHK